MTRGTPLRLTLLFACLLWLLPNTASAADAPLLAESLGGYWYNFKKFWGGVFGSVGGVVGIALGVGAVSIFIITRGKWAKK